MALIKKASTSGKLDQLLAESREKEKGYRERALKIFPWICAKCGREFDGKRLKELTVHHKDHNHDNNPPDGSNWELLCLYCHDNEHARDLVADCYDGAARETDHRDTSFGNKPFAALEALLKKDDTPKKG
jgi:predicted HNH restriction endonuclease